MSGNRRGRRHGWERERWKKIHEREKKERKRDRDRRKKDRETGAGERDIGRETGVGRERERERQGRKRKKLQTQKIHGILSCSTLLRRTECSTTSDVLQSTVVLQSGYQRQGGKEKDRRRDGLGEREKDITRGDRII